jgi:hypothetical protein
MNLPVTSQFIYEKESQYCYVAISLFQDFFRWRNTSRLNVLEVKIQSHYDFARPNALRGKKDLLIRVERLERDDSPGSLEGGFQVKVEKVPPRCG